MEFKITDEIKELRDNIIYSSFGNRIKHIIRFVKRLPRYVKLAWNNEDWDYTYLYDMIEFKLKDFLKAQQEDIWHTKRETSKCQRQIKICLARLDRYRNWTDYCLYPINDIKLEKINDGYFKMVHTNNFYQLVRDEAIKFEEHNYNKFWEDFLKWHQNWWT